MGQQIWDLWYPKAAAQGMAFARGRLDATETLLVHALPDTIDVYVRDDDDFSVARGRDLIRTGDFPMAKLMIRNGAITRADGWPQPGDLGLPVLLPGGEAGILRSWWNAEDGSEWRWQIELYNHR